MSNDDKKWDGLTIQGTLPIGVYYAGTRHKAFTLRLGMAGDLIAAQEEHPDGPFQLVTLEVFRRQLISLGDIPADVLTTDLLRESLSEIDLAYISDKDSALEKKLKPQNVESASGGESSTPLSATATA